MRALLDTHVLLWWLNDADQVGPDARALFEDPQSELLWSSASTWEIGIKAKLGKLKLPEPFERFASKLIPDNKLIGLPIYHDHTVRAASLPPIHRDPFDRLLVAQAMVERVPLVTRGRALEAYGIECIAG